MGVNSEIALQIINSFPFAACLYNLKSERLEYSNGPALSIMKEIGVIDDLTLFNLNSLVDQDNSDRFIQFWKESKTLAPGISLSISGPISLPGQLRANFRLEATALSEADTRYLLLKVVEKKETLSHLEEEFINLAGHDLLSPVRKISTFLDRFKEKYPDTLADNPYLKRIENSVINLRSLVDSLVKYSEVSMRTTNLARVSLDDVVDEIIKGLKDSMPQVEIDIQRNNLPDVYADRDLCVVLFSQLIDNAIRFRELNTNCQINISGEVSRIENQALPHNFCRVTIRDNGIGFSEGKAKEIFRPFVQLNSKGERGGNGLGLAICAKIATSLGWQLQGDSNEDSGTCFTLILPQSTYRDV